MEACIYNLEVQHLICIAFFVGAHNHPRCTLKFEIGMSLLITFRVFHAIGHVLPNQNFLRLLLLWIDQLSDIEDESQFCHIR